MLNIKSAQLINDPNINKEQRDFETRGDFFANIYSQLERDARSIVEGKEDKELIILARTALEKYLSYDSSSKIQQAFDLIKKEEQAFFDAELNNSRNTYL